MTTAPPRPRSGCFSTVNGVEVYDNGAVRIWRDAGCGGRWRPWEQEVCPVCGMRRDGLPPAILNTEGLT